MLADALPDTGVDPARLGPGGDLAARFRRAMDVVRARSAAGELGFLELPRDRGLASSTRGAATALARVAPADLVVVGIGGSSLGAAALGGALLLPEWNGHGSGARGGRPRLHVLGNPDPDSVASLLARLDLRRTVVNVVSKSGSTVETLACLFVLWERIEAELGPDGVRERLVVTTDPERGFLRRLAAKRRLRSLPVPPGVGGRFSVLSPVGLLPAQMTGVDTRALLAGAAAMAARCETPELTANPAGMLAALLHAAHAERGANVHVFMPYADRLRAFAAWVQQLWGESLGKAARTDGAPAAAGPTPLPSLGPADQHSLLQLFMEGPRDKVVVFIAPDEPGAEMRVPAPFGEAAALAESSARSRAASGAASPAADSARQSRRLRRAPSPAALLGGHTLFGIMQRERFATAEALRLAGRPSMTVAAGRLDAHAVGGLVMLFQIAVVIAGALYGVNPLDQPGVELGKRLARDLLGAGGARPELPTPDPRWLA